MNPLGSFIANVFIASWSVFVLYVAVHFLLKYW